MGIFDFLKPKKDSVTACVEKPEVKRAMMTMKFEYLQKQVENFQLVGRTDDAHKAIAEYMVEYSQTIPGPASTPQDLARLSYFLAYIFIPDLVHKRWDEFLRRWNHGIPIPTYLALYGAIVQNQRLTLDQIAAFKAQPGRLSNDVDVYLLQCPPPPQISAGDFDIGKLLAMPLEKRPVLAPFFVAALHDRRTGQRHLYTLGQAIHSGTTLRCVTADGANCNCGPGPHPLVPEFLEALKRQV